MAILPTENSKLLNSLFANIPITKIDGDDIYFTEENFKKILDRCEQEGHGVFGIEAWIDDFMDLCETCEAYNLSANDPRWYRKAFDKLRLDGLNKLYFGTFGINVIE